MQHLPKSNLCVKALSQWSSPEWRVMSKRSCNPAVRHCLPRRLLALSAVCPGASTLIGNLMKSSAVRPLESQQRMLAGREWLRAYVNGCSHQVSEAGRQAGRLQVAAGGQAL